MSSDESELDRFRREYAKRRAERSLLEFIRQGWPWVEPAAFVSGWHIECTCEHLEAVVNGEILRLLINEPPRHMKSLGLNVFLPAWVWARQAAQGKWLGPGVRFMHLAYQEPLATRDSNKCRRLMASPWYQKNWGGLFSIVTDQVTRVENDKGGHRLSSSVHGVMGEGADIIAFDDPHDYIKVESEPERQKLLTFFDEGLTTRFNDRERGAMIVNMQRLDSRDLSSHILAKELKAIALHGPSQRKWVHVCLPFEFEVDHPFPMRTQVVCKATGEVWKDLRKPGDLLWPQRFTPEGARDLKIEMNSNYAVAGQLQQRPAPRGGGMFKRPWFANKIIGTPECPIAVIPKGTKFVRHWDLAATDKKTAARTAGVKLGKMPDGNYVVAHCIAVQKEGPEVRDLIKATAATDGKSVEISLPKDPGQAGKVQASDFVRFLGGYTVHTEAETGSKEVRAEPFASQAAAGNVYLVQGEWLDDYLDELVTFPNGNWKDRVDATSGAFGRLNARQGEHSSGFVAGGTH